MILSRVLLHAQERWDLEDFDQGQVDILTDAQFWTKEFLANAAFILKGFQVSGVGSPSPCTVTMADATLINANNSGEFSWFTSPSGASPITVALQPSQRNYLELQLSTVDGTPLTRAFWDPSANGGSGAEFNQTVNSVTDIEVTVNVNTTGFTGSSNTIPLCFIDTDSSNGIKIISDKRPMFFRLGQPGSPLGGYSWSSQVEPSAIITLSSVSGAFIVGETLTFSGGATAVCTSGGSTPIQANVFSSDSYAVGNTLTGSSSGAHGTVVTVQDSFTGADKDIGDFRDMLAALMNEIRALKGTAEWFNNTSTSLTGAMKFINSCIVESTTAVTKAVVTWDGSNLSLTDSNGSPSSADVISLIRLLGSSQTLNLQRQDGQASTSKIAISDGQVMFVSLPSTGNRSFSGTGAGSTNYQVAARASFSVSDSNYWIAYREGSKIIFRGIGELQAGESEIIGDTLPLSVLNAIGLPDESSAPSYSSNIRGVSAESIISREGVLTDAVGDEQEDRTMFFKSDAPIVWTGSQLIFTSNILLRVLNSKGGGTYDCTIPSSFSPLTVNNGSSIYFTLNRSTQTVSSLIDSAITAIPVQTQSNKNTIVLCRRENVSSSTYGEEDDIFSESLLYIPLHKQALRMGQSCYLGESGHPASGGIRVDYFDPVSTTLPSGTSVTIDGNLGVNGDLVLYANLGSGNNEVYLLGGVGTSLTWTPQYIFTEGQIPLVGEKVVVTQGNSYANQTGEFNGTTWLFNKTIRLFNPNGDYIEIGDPITVSLANNTTANVFNVAYSGSQNWQMGYSLTRGLTKESGILLMTTDGTTVSVTKTGPNIGLSGVSFTGNISGSNIYLNYTTDNSGTTGTLKLWTIRWSDISGGPGGVLNYTAGGGSSVIAAGNPGDIQFKDSGGGLAADDRFKVNMADGAITLGNQELLALTGPFTILDNQPTFQTLVSYNASTWKRAIFDYSITRNGEERVGRLMVSNNGSIAGFDDDFVETQQIQQTGITLQAVYSSGNILIQYTSNSQGVGGSFYLAGRRW